MFNNRRQLESKKSCGVLLIAWASVGLVLAIAPPSASPTESTRESGHAVTMMAPDKATRTAGLLVPKRVRLIIKYQRTALV